MRMHHYHALALNTTPWRPFPSCYSRLRVDPEDHAVVLSEHPWSLPDDREAMAEVRGRRLQSLPPAQPSEQDSTHDGLQSRGARPHTSCTHSKDATQPSLLTQIAAAAIFVLLLPPAKVMFETFTVAGLYQAPAPVLALYGSVKQRALAEPGAHVSHMGKEGHPAILLLLTWRHSCHLSTPRSTCTLHSLAHHFFTFSFRPHASLFCTSQARMTGLVVDAGELMTHVVPVVDGRMSLSGLRSSAVGGAAITRMVQAVMR